MNSAHELVKALKRELKVAGITYKDLASRIGLAESSVKRMFSAGDFSLSRIDDVLRVLKMDFAELSRRIANAQSLRRELSLEQERAVVADPKLMLLAICCISHWTFEQMVASYLISEAECIAYLLQLDQLGFIELRPQNRYCLKVSNGFRWRPHGPVMAYFRKYVCDDYYSGGFDGEGEMMMVVHGEISNAQATHFVERLQRLGQDFAQQHLTDQKVSDEHKRPYTLVIGMRSWLFAPFRELKRPDVPIRKH
ncbi:helix-turn-helix transcriptional regulator [Actimicrobium sp. CCI2.3]|uniref:helix-turn-helix domain-containing protein n=1 Tax=Actimicrobium sp. CCI2.3 TaxID=3048616 RepID=UPI002AB5CA3E|nr:helix-turn-helix transcriptional regulator [Actimicrobium sp. CCI2.3]MDY7575499.1 helix-turn-helix transcriptional regulator [Actimicrobium sp. CCI2.3]MEB0023735.1 helix-turn-helix transcriptional regulator [Actimicrobium sp. CCI2.3]